MANGSLRCAALIVLGLLVTASVVAADPSPPPSTASAKPLPNPAWPDNGIAQRHLPDAETMFVEDDHGMVRAWVISAYTRDQVIDADHAHAKALDFFSGRVMPVQVVLEEDGHESQAFIDAKGEVHVNGLDPRYVFSPDSEARNKLPGIDFNGNDAVLHSTISACNVHLIATSPKENYITGEKPPAMWSKFPIYHKEAGPKGCSSGILHSSITSALDLGDGTFLAAEGCFVFRLRKSDLSPVGSAPALRVVDESTIQAAIAKVKGQRIKDVTGYLIEALHLPSAPDASCKEG